MRELFSSETPSTFRRAKPARASTRVLSSSEGQQGAGMQYQISSLYSTVFLRKIAKSIKYKNPVDSLILGVGGMRARSCAY
ncbi:hypothetical protein A3B93_01600 [Candidatus Nomurabacteria bacterium RIFCSPHIGHO2_02_FULL_42_24]|uniref:Uncharacterized protein n=1 Tax=Candidatus Nomurabacteria bacterium RIFCSPHIGHO2_02_FULL_42_24 TaxID=1801757 RepID=A0A1F6WI97_9BACT|nr:MAG: hypothetical protein A3B93_01600 [Candidatus Nomurabacteria bacterium RIFCSPHIGHO2_02_FULL_42_24]